MMALVVGGGLAAAYLPGRVRRARAPVAVGPAPAPAPVAKLQAPPSATGLKEMLEVGHRARLAQADAPSAAARRRATVEAIDRGPADLRRAALRTLALDDRPAAEAIARARLMDHVLFSDAARLLLVRADGAPAAADLALVRKALRTGEHDDGSRAAVSTLVLEVLARLDSPATATFATMLRQDPSRRVQAVGERFAGDHSAARGSVTKPRDL